MGFAEALANPSTPVSDKNKKRKANDIFTAEFGDLDFKPDEELLTPMKKEIKRHTNHAVTLTVYYRVVKNGSRVPLGFGLSNSRDIREELTNFVALEEGHYKPFFINEDILSKRRAGRWPRNWPQPAWFHTAFRTIPTVEKLKLAMIK